MTREEIVKMGYKKFPQDIIEIVNDDNSITREDCNYNLRNGYMQGLIDNNISFSTDVDEAAKEYASIQLGNEYDEYFSVDINILEAFKAGAEWMAKQGVSFEDLVCEDEYMGYTLADTIWNNNLLVGKFKEGDKVIVQIRKV